MKGEKTGVHEASLSFQGELERSGGNGFEKFPSLL